MGKEKGIRDRVAWESPLGDDCILGERKEKGLEKTIVIPPYGRPLTLTSRVVGIGKGKIIRVMFT